MKAADEGKGLLQHINFWQQDELRLEHPEVQVGACQCVSAACWCYLLLWLHYIVLWQLWVLDTLAPHNPSFLLDAA